VRRKLGRQLLEEARPDRARADEAHVAAQDVPELRDLVELSRPEPATEEGRLALRPLDELGPEVRPESALGAGPERPELDHREDPSAAADALAPVEDRPAAREEDAERDQRSERQREQQEERREQEIERPELEVDEPAAGRRAGKRREAQDERIARPRTG